jgi:hypothetical protein
MMQYKHNRLISEFSRRAEALCILTGLIPIDLKIAEAFQCYHLTKINKERKNWLIVIWKLNIGSTLRKQLYFLLETMRQAYFKYSLTEVSQNRG